LVHSQINHFRQKLPQQLYLLLSLIKRTLCGAPQGALSASLVVLLLEPRGEQAAQPLKGAGVAAGILVPEVACLVRVRVRVFRTRVGVRVFRVRVRVFRVRVRVFRVRVRVRVFRVQVRRQGLPNPQPSSP
jgi:hypothetical protein